MAETKLDTAKIVKLIEAARELHLKSGELLDEIDALLGGKAGVGADIRVLEGIFDQLWCARYAAGETRRYVWTASKDKPQIKRLLKNLGLEETGKRMARYLASDEPYYVRARHPFGVFVASINSHAAPADVAAFELVADCRHQPPCRNDQEHTKRRGAELRA